MDRRSFLIKSTIGMGALSTPVLLSCSFHQSIDQVGIQIYTVRTELENDFEGSLKKLADIGYSYLELFNYNEGKIYGRPVREVKNLLIDLELDVISSHVDLSYLRNNWEKTLEDAVTLNQKFIVCPYLDASERESIEHYYKLADLFNRSAEKSKEYGLQFAYHNHAFEFEELDGLIPMNVLLKETDSDLVDFQLDIYWIKKAGFNPIDYFNQFPHRFSTWHVKDMGQNSQKPTTEVGSGVTDWVELFKNVNLSGMKYFFVEQEDFSMPVFKSVTQSYQFLKQLKY